MTKKISLWAKAFPPFTGGVESYSKAVASTLDNAGMLSEIVTWTKKQDPAPLFYEPKFLQRLYGQNDISCLMSGLKYLFLSGRAKRKSTLYFCTTWKAAVPAYLASLEYIVVCHGRELYSTGWRRILAKKVYGNATKILAVSKFTKDKLEMHHGIDAYQVEVIPNGIDNLNLFDIDLQSKWLATKERLNFYVVCRHEPRKNIIKAIRIFNALLGTALAATKNLHFYIAGTGETIPEEIRLVESLGISRHVTHLGRISDDQLFDLHSTGHVFLHPQISLNGGRDFEGFGLVIADAMAAASFVVAGDSGGTPELLTDSNCGLVVTANSTPEKIAAHLSKELLASESIIVKLETGRLFAANEFRWERTTAVIAKYRETEKL